MRHLMVSMILALCIGVPAQLGMAAAQSTGPGTHKDESSSVTKQGLGNERSSERTGSSGTVDQGLKKKNKSREGKQAQDSNGNTDKSTEFRDGSGMQSGSTGANSAPATK